MPIEIREVVIRATLEKKGGLRPDSAQTEEDIEKMVEKIVRECTEKVMERINNKLER